jgi:hypothetical protein
LPWLSCQTSSSYQVKYTRGLLLPHQSLCHHLRAGSSLKVQLCHGFANITRDGNDGPWSTFVFQIGTPPQTVKLLPSTASYETWAIDPMGCQAEGDLTNCHTLRGELFNYNASSTWDPNLSNTSTDIYSLELEVPLSYTGKGRLVHPKPFGTSRDLLLTNSGMALMILPLDT